MPENDSIDCQETSALLSEVAASGCRSPWEIDLVEIALLNRLFLVTGGLCGFPLTADDIGVTVDFIGITADQVEYLCGYPLTADLTGITADFTGVTADQTYY